MVRRAKGLKNDNEPNIAATVRQSHMHEEAAMTKLFEFLAPTSRIEVWGIRHGVVVLTGLFILWVSCMILTRGKLFEEDDVPLQVYFGCLVPLIIVVLASSALLLATAYQYQQSGIQLWYVIPYGASVFISWCFALQLTGKINRRIRQKERIEKL